MANRPDKSPGREKYLEREIMYPPSDNEALKKMLKVILPCFGDPQPECVGKCILEPECANKWLKDQKKKEECK